MASGVCVFHCKRQVVVQGRLVHHKATVLSHPHTHAVCCIQDV